MKKNIITLLVACVSLFAVVSCTDLEEIWYDEVTPDTFYQSESDVLAALYRPYTHIKWALGESFFKPMEYSADQMAISTKTSDWYNDGEYYRWIAHTWNYTESGCYSAWYAAFMGIALALDTQNDLQNLDYESVGLTQEDKDDHVAQLSFGIAFLYRYALDFFGGVPIYTSNEGDNMPRSTAKEVFDHIESLLLDCIDKLETNTYGQENYGNPTKASAAAVLMQLYFNAGSYIGEDYDSKAKVLAEAIISGTYGTYKLETDWQGPWDFENSYSPEMIWGIPSARNYLEYNWFYWYFYHYSANDFFDFDEGQPWNGAHLAPSLDPMGNLYDYNIGMPFSRFNDEDLRKKQYVYDDGTSYDGMFLMGPQYYPDGVTRLTGSREYSNLPFEFVDQVAKFATVTDGDYSGLVSSMANGEESSGIRLVRVPIPNSANNALRWGADNPVIRLAEVYYTLAELKFNEGDKTGAAELINIVRARNFENGNDPDPVTASNLDKYRLAAEWGTEFIAEGRRRSDLIRWGFWTTEDWWDHTATNNDNLKLYPIPETAMGANNALTQNPGY